LTFIVDSRGNGRGRRKEWVINGRGRRKEWVINGRGRRKEWVIGSSGEGEWKGQEERVGDRI
jgi:hypothetical protein